MIRVGVTGGIGSGKTTLCNVWESLGAYVLYADDFAKELMVSDEELIKKIKETFGEESYHTDGSLNRAYLAEEAFNKGRVEELNNIVHPQLWKRINDLAERKEQEGITVFVKEAAILLNNGRPDNLDFVVLMMADEETRTHRVKVRDETTSEKVLERINKQPDFESLTHLCDFLILNNGSIQDLEQKAKEIFQLLQ